MEEDRIKDDIRSQLVLLSSRQIEESDRRTWYEDDSCRGIMHEWNWKETAQVQRKWNQEAPGWRQYSKADVDLVWSGLHVRF